MGTKDVSQLTLEEISNLCKNTHEARLKMEKKYGTQEQTNKLWEV